jgi:hypothetical protein
MNTESVFDERTLYLSLHPLVVHVVVRIYEDALQQKSQRIGRTAKSFHLNLINLYRRTGYNILGNAFIGLYGNRLSGEGIVLS